MKQGKRKKINLQANRELKKIYFNKGINYCEANLNDKCTHGLFLSFAHKHKRIWYYDKPDEMLWNYNQAIVCCISCHQILEKNAELTRQVFEKLRCG
jgi:hypothetical protein